MRIYEVSAQNRIVSVSENWDGFARANGGDGAVSQVVMGREVWDFMAGIDTRSYMNALFFAVRRAGTRLSIPYRCDVPQGRQLFQMQIEPLEEGGLRLTHRPVDLMPLPAATAIDPASDLSCCGQCLRWRFKGAWSAEDFHPEAVTFPVDYVVCPSCRTEAQRVIGRALSGQLVH